MRLQTNKLGKVSITVDKNPWTSTKCYRKLTIVREPNAYVCYISIKSVPKGIDLTDENYWFILSSLREEIQLDFNRIVEAIRILTPELIANINRAIELAGDFDRHASNTTIHVTSTEKEQIGSIPNLITAVNSKINTSEKGSPNGVATLDGGGKVISNQLPSYVDDIIDILGCYDYYNELYRPLIDGKLKLNPTASDFNQDTRIPPTAEPGTYYMALYHTLGGSNPGIYHYVSGMTWTREYGETGKIYVEKSTNKQYRFAEEDYIPHEVVASPGTTDDVTEGSTNKYFTENRARAAVEEAMLQRELLSNKVTVIREVAEANNTKYPTELATRILVDNLLELISDLDDRVTALEEGSGSGSDSDSDSSSSGILIPMWYVGQISRTKIQFSELTVEQLVSNAQPINTDQKTATFTINESCWFCMIPEGEDIQSAQYTVSGITSTFTEQEIKNGFVTDVTHDDIEIDGITYKIYVNRNTALVDSNAAASFTLKTR